MRPLDNITPKIWVVLIIGVVVLIAMVWLLPP